MNSSILADHERIMTVANRSNEMKEYGMRVLMMLAMALILAGCGGAPQKLRAENPARQAVLDAAVAKCQYEAEVGATGAGAGAVGAIEVEYRKVQARGSLFKLCMRANGWDA